MSTVNYRKIIDIKFNDNSISVKGLVSEKSQVNPNGGIYKNSPVSTAKLCDDTGHIMITFWNNDAYDIMDNNYIELTNGYCNIVNEELNITAGNYGKIKIIKDQIICKKVNIPSLFTEIGKINSPMKRVSVKGKISKKQIIHSKKDKMCMVTLTDDTGEILATLWRDDVENYDNGDEISIIDGYVIKNPSDEGYIVTAGFHGKIIGKGFDSGNVGEI